MKKNYLYCICLGLAISGCAKYNKMMDSMYSSDDNIKIQKHADSEDKSKDTKKEPASTATINLDYKPQTKEVDANIGLNVNAADQENIYLTWQPPKGSDCYSTSFMLMPNKETILDTQSVLDSNNKLCAGSWTATVTDKETKRTLAKASLNIK